MKTIGGRRAAHSWRRGALVLALAAVWLLIAAGVGQAAVSVQAQTRQVVMDERFTDNARGWPTTFTTSTGTPGRNFFNENGYNIAIPDQPSHYAWFIGSNPPPVGADVYVLTG